MKNAINDDGKVSIVIAHQKVANKNGIIHDFSSLVDNEKHTANINDL